MKTTNYKKEDRIEMIRQAYAGLFQLVSMGLFDKYTDFIDTYAEVDEQEQETLYGEIVQHKDTAMLAQYIKEKGRQEGKREEGKERLISFVRKAKQQGISVPTIARIVELDVSIIDKILDNEDINIPLHLLDSADKQ